MRLFSLARSPTNPMQFGMTGQIGTVINIADPYASNADEWGVGSGELSPAGISIDTCYDWGNCSGPKVEGGVEMPKA